MDRKQTGFLCGLNRFPGRTGVQAAAQPGGSMERRRHAAMLLSLFLCFSMLLSLMPLPALAENDGPGTETTEAGYQTSEEENDFVEGEENSSPDGAAEERLQSGEEGSAEGSEASSEGETVGADLLQDQANLSEGETQDQSGDGTDDVENPSGGTVPEPGETGAASDGTEPSNQTGTVSDGEENRQSDMMPESGETATAGDGREPAGDGNDGSETTDTGMTGEEGGTDGQEEKENGETTGSLPGPGQETGQDSPADRKEDEEGSRESDQVLPETGEKQGEEDGHYPSEVVLDYESVTLDALEGFGLTAAVIPASCSQDIIWSSTDPAVAAVDETGMITAVGRGMAVITATATQAAEDGSSVSAECAVTVRSDGIIAKQVEDLTSVHPYGEGENRFWEFSLSDEGNLALTFSENTELGTGDFILMQFGENEQISYSADNIDTLAGKTVAISGSWVRIWLISDSDGNTGWGFEVTAVSEAGEEDELQQAQSFSDPLAQMDSPRLLNQPEAEPNLNAGPTPEIKETAAPPKASVTLNQTLLTLEALDEATITATVETENAADAARLTLQWESTQENAVQIIDFAETARDESAGTITGTCTVRALRRTSDTPVTITATAVTVSDSVPAKDTETSQNAAASCTIVVTNDAIVVSDWTQLESDHPYYRPINQFWQYTDPNARALTLTFDPQTATVNPTDTIIVTDGSKNRIGYISTGTLLSGQTVTVFDKTVRIYLLSNESGTGNYGFKVTDLHTSSAGAEGYTVRYYANGGTNPPETQEKKKDIPLTLTTEEPTRAHYTFKGWSTERLSGRVSWYPGDEYDDNEDLTLYAVWERVSTFNESNRGSSASPYYGPTGSTGETQTYPKTPINLERPEANYDKPVVHIRTVQDLIEFSENCSLDVWSDRLPVVLENDLSLSDVDFQPIPLFNGSFDGRGHSIFDLSLTDALAPCGLFLETGKDAIIRNLSVTGTVMPHGDNDMTGGIVGLNRGCVMNCSFTGTVAGKLETGAVVGRNEVTGLLTGCASSAAVSGLDQTGGVCGMNYGTILACESGSYVNTESVDPGLHLDDIDTSSLLNFVHSLTTETAGITTDTGGICGYNEGFIESCVSTAPVGYSRLGYNVGGIAGRSRGFISSSRNEGSVYGRRDVGGITGQAEPYVEVSQPQNLTAGLSYRMYALHQSIDDAVHDAEVLSSDISGQLSGLSDYLIPVEEAFRELSITDPESVLNLRAVLLDTVSGMAGQLQSMSDSVGEGSGVLSEDMQAITNNLDALSGSALQTVALLSSSQNEDIIVDESASAAADAITLGKTTDCRNNGEINGESNVGGIVGCMALENSLDPEMDLTATDSLLRNRYAYRSVVARSVNNGPVSAWYECAGGIVGKADIGYVVNCAAYSSVGLEDGAYAGGIAGLCYGTIQSCVSRSSLSGTKYVGGILGNGYAGNGSDDKPSSVSACYSLVEIKDRPQFSGAVSGGAEGDYLANYFVPAGYAGLNKISIQGQAEPILFPVFNAVLSLPEESKIFTLRFVLEDVVIKELTFEYGASFTRDVFPEVENRDGAYAVWDRTDLTDLRFDTTVTATYRRSETALGTDLLRDNGRPVAYVIGQFQEGDQLTAEILPTEEGEISAFQKGWLQTAREQVRSIFHDPDYTICYSIAERIRLDFPEDGLATHTIHYTSPDGVTEDYRLYLKTENGYKRLEEEVFGSYFSVDVPGSSPEITLVRTVQSWWFLAYIAGALAALALMICVVVNLMRRLKARPGKPKRVRTGEPLKSRLRAHRKTVTVIVVLTGSVLLAAALLLQTGWLQSGFAGYRVLKNFTSAECDLLCEIDIRTEEGKIDISTTAQQVSQDGNMIICADQYGINLYICNGSLYLENGRAFRLVNENIEQRNLLRLALNAVRQGHVIKTTDGNLTRYSTEIENDAVEEVLNMYLSEDVDFIFQGDKLQGEMDVRDGALTEIRFVGEGSTENGTNYDFKVSLEPQPLTERPTIPQAVLDAIQSGKTGEGNALLTEDALQLFAAWIKNDRAEAVDASIDVRADCGVVSLDDRYDYFRQKVEETDIHCVSSRLFQVYFTDKAACTSNGKLLSSAENRLMDTAQLIPLVREFFLRGSYTSEDLGSGKRFTLTIGEEEISGLVERVLPELQDLNLNYETCVLHATVRDGELYSIELECGGSVRVVTRDVDATASVIVRFKAPDQHSIPKAVKNTLVSGK